MIEIRLDGDPVAKGRHRHRVDKTTGRVLTHADPKTARFEDRLAWAAQAVMAGRPLLTGPLVVIVDVYRSIPASWSKARQRDALEGRMRPTNRPDVDNFAKITDALNRVVWMDDSQIVDLRARKFLSNRPRIEIRVDKLSTSAL